LAKAPNIVIITLTPGSQTYEAVIYVTGLDVADVQRVAERIRRVMVDLGSILRNRFGRKLRIKRNWVKFKFVIVTL
jgi:hypothetical protein